MKNPFRFWMYGALGIVILLVTAAAGINVIFDVKQYKHPIEASLARAIGMEVRIRGPVSLHFLPRVWISLPEVHVGREGHEVFSADEIQFSPEILPYLFGGRVRIDRVALYSPRLHPERGVQNAIFPEWKLSELSIEDGELSYADRSSGVRAEFVGVDLALSHLASSGGSGRALLAQLAFRGNASVRSLQLNGLVAWKIGTELEAQEGRIRLRALQMNLFGGHSRGEATLELQRLWEGGDARIELFQTASLVYLSQIFPEDHKYLIGQVDAWVHLKSAGRSLLSMTRALRGKVSLSGENLLIRSISARSSATGVTEIGGLLVAGPLRPLISRQARAARVFNNGSRSGNQEVRKLVLNWEIQDGIAHAQDVALSTSAHTVAFQGSVDLVSRRYREFYLGIVDAEGCTELEQRIAGSIAHPRFVAVLATGRGICKNKA